MLCAPCSLHHAPCSCDYSLHAHAHDRVDTLLNVFLAIAVDNLANAQELTAAEEEQQEEQQQVGTREMNG